MANETVQLVKNAEILAAKIEEDALKQKEEILSSAETKAENHISTTIKNAQNKASEDYKKASKNGRQIVENAKEEAEKESLLLKEMVKRKEHAAIELVLSNVI